MFKEKRKRERENKREKERDKKRLQDNNYFIKEMQSANNTKKQIHKG